MKKIIYSLIILSFITLISCDVHADDVTAKSETTCKLREWNGTKEVNVIPKKRGLKKLDQSYYSNDKKIYTCEGTKDIGADAKTFKIIIPGILAQDKTNAYLIGSTRGSSSSEGYKVVVYQNYGYNNVSCINNPIDGQYYCNTPTGVSIITNRPCMGRSSTSYSKFFNLPKLAGKKVILLSGLLTSNSQTISNFITVDSGSAGKITGCIISGFGFTPQSYVTSSPVVLCTNSTMYFYHNSGSQLIQKGGACSYYPLEFDTGSVRYKSSINPKTTQVIGNYFLDRGVIYSPDGNKQNISEGITTFSMIDYLRQGAGLYKINNKIYRSLDGSLQPTTIDLTTFKKLDSLIYKDRNHVYDQNGILSGDRDPSSFKITSGGWGFYGDKNKISIAGYIYTGVDLNTFKSLGTDSLSEGSHYVIKDKDGVYVVRNGKRQNRDPNNGIKPDIPTFMLLSGSSQFFYQDKNHIYGFTGEVLSGVDSATLRQIDFMFYKDKNRVYILSAQGPGRIATPLDPQKSSIIKRKNGYSEDTYLEDGVYSCKDGERSCVKMRNKQTKKK